MKDIQKYFNSLNSEKRRKAKVHFCFTSKSQLTALRTKKNPKSKQKNMNLYVTDEMNMEMWSETNTQSVAQSSTSKKEIKVEKEIVWFDVSYEFINLPSTIVKYEYE